MNNLDYTVRNIKDIFKQNKKAGLYDDLLKSRPGEIFQSGSYVIKFREEFYAKAEHINATFIHALGVHLALPFTVKLEPDTFRYFNKQPEINAKTHISINPFISGEPVDTLREKYKNDDTKLKVIDQKITDQLLVPLCIGGLVDPHGGNFIWNENQTQPATLIDCEFGLYDPFIDKAAPDAVIDLFKAMTDQSFTLESTQVENCNDLFDIFRNGFDGRKMDQYRKQCDDILIKLSNNTNKLLKEKGLRDVAIQRTLTLRNYL